MLFQFRSGYNATTTTTNICDICGYVLKVNKCQGWFRKFASGNFELSDNVRADDLLHLIMMLCYQWFSRIQDSEYKKQQIHSAGIKYDQSTKGTTLRKYGQKIFQCVQRKENLDDKKDLLNLRSWKLFTILKHYLGISILYQLNQNQLIS